MRVFSGELQRKSISGAGYEIIILSEDNHSRSTRLFSGDCIIRSSPHRPKLVRVVEGEILDVAVDMRRVPQRSESRWLLLYLAKIIGCFDSDFVRVASKAADNFFTKPVTTTLRNMKPTLLWSDPKLSPIGNLRVSPSFPPGNAGPSCATLTVSSRRI